MADFKKIIQAALPPVLYNALSRSRHRPAAPALQYVPGGWNERACPGWNVESVRDHSVAAWPQTLARAGGTETLGDMLGAKTAEGQLLAVSFAYALALAAHGKRCVSLLDWGGGVGHYRLIAEAALPGVVIDYSCKDVPLLAEAGQRLHPEAQFYSDDGFRCRQYDFVLASSSLQYARCWRQEFGKLAQCAGGYLFVTRTPTHEGTPDYLYSQSAYGTSYLGWSINRTGLLEAAAEERLALVREFVVSEWNIADAPAPSRQQGFLFRKVSA